MKSVASSSHVVHRSRDRGGRGARARPGDRSRGIHHVVSLYRRQHDHAGRKLRDQAGHRQWHRLPDRGARRSTSARSSRSKPTSMNKPPAKTEVVFKRYGSGLRAQVRVGGRLERRHPDRDGRGGKASRQARRDPHRTSRPGQERQGQRRHRLSQQPRTARAAAVRSRGRRLHALLTTLRLSASARQTAASLLARVSSSSAAASRDPIRRRAP